MAQFLEAALVIIILLGSSAIGVFIRPLLSERHKSRELIEFLQLVVAMLMTFAALVLGLLTSSVKSSFDKVGNDLRGLAVQLIQLDRSLREWGAETRPTRWRLVEETGSSISTPFYVVLVFWLAIVFGSFGLTAPRNALSYTAIALGGL